MLRRQAIASGALALLARPSFAQTPAWPNRPVRIVVPFTPGGSNDAMARPLSERLQARFGQPFVIENRPGAGSSVGVQYVAQSAPDGHTLLVTTSSVAAIAPVQRLNFDPTKELDCVALLARAPLVVLVPPNSRFKNIQDIVAEARRRPGDVTFASSGPGSTTHLATELFALRAGLQMQHVPYRGTAGALTDLVAGRVDVMFTTIASGAGQIRGGLLKVIAWTGEGRPDGTPDAPTVKSAGIEYESGIWWGLFGPRGLPAAMRSNLNEAVNIVLRDASFARYLAGEGAIPSPMTPAEFSHLLADEAQAMREVVTAARVTAD